MLIHIYTYFSSLYIHTVLVDLKNTSVRLFLGMNVRQEKA